MESDSASLDVLVFELSGHRYALPCADVREIARAVSMAPLPRAPEIVEGVVNVHGAVIPVLDLRLRFRLPPKELAHTDHLIVASTGERTFALRADRALDLVRLDPEQIDRSIRDMPGVAHVAGVATTDEGMVLVHDLRTFLSATEAWALDRALDAPPDGGTA